MPGLKEDELMHEWMQEDSPEYDVEPERIMLELARDNELMLQLIRECGKEDELRKKLRINICERRDLPRLDSDVGSSPLLGSKGGEHV